jgi:hypothetical protein
MSERIKFLIDSIAGQIHKQPLTSLHQPANKTDDQTRTTYQTEQRTEDGRGRAWSTLPKKFWEYHERID